MPKISEIQLLNHAPLYIVNQQQFSNKIID